jgi:iron complex outermembrane receptor protein
MKIHRFILFVVLSFISVVSYAQEKGKCTNTIEGKILDLETKEPLPFVNIQIEGETLGTVSDEDGYFIFKDLCKKEYDLIFSYVGYKKARHHHDFHHPFVEIYLASDEVVLQSVVVEAESSRTDLNSTSSQVLTSKELDAVASESLADAASQISGVNTISTGQNVVKPIIHGLHSNRILILNNGLRHEFQNWGIDHAPEIDPSLIDRLEVVKGAATVRFGPDALGGAILIQPPAMKLSTPLQGKVNLVGKSNGRSYESTLELKKGFKWWSVLAGGSFVNQGDLQAPDYNLSNTGKEERSYYGGFRIHPLPQVDIEGYFSRFDQNLGILRGSVFGNLDDLQLAIESDTPLFTEDFTYEIEQPRQDIQHDLYKLSGRYVAETHALNIQYGYQINRRKEFGVRRGDAPNIDLELVTESLDIDWRHPRIGLLSGKIGVQLSKQANDNLPGTGTVPFVPNYDSKRAGVYLIESLTTGLTTFEFGFRYDYMDAQITGREPDNTIYRNTILYENITTTLGFKKEMQSGDVFRSNFGTAWRPPNVAELYRFGQHSFFLEYGLWRYTINEDFDFVSTTQGILDENDRAVPPEVGYKWINTYEVNREGFRAEFTGYVNYVENFIYSKPAGLTRTPRGFFVYFIYDQTDALFWGLDLTAEWTHSRLFTSNVRGSYLWSQQIDPNDNFAGQPPAKLSYEISYTPKIKGLENHTLKFYLAYTFEQFQHPRILTVDEFLFANQNGVDRFKDDASDFDLLPPPDGYLMSNFSWSANWKKLGWRFQVRNIFNVSYRNYTDRLRYFADDLGRNFILSLTYQI